MPKRDGTPMMRRAKGTGSLRHLDGDRWQVIGRVDGHQVTRVFTAPNGTEAERLAPSVREAAATDYRAKSRGQDAEATERAERQSWTVSRYADFYLEAWAGPHLSHTAYQRYKQILKNQIKPNIGHLKMSELTETDLQRLYTTLASKGARRYGDAPLSGPTIWTVYNVIRALYAFAVQVQHDFATNPAAGKSARPRDVERTGTPKRAVDVAEVERFVALAVEDAPTLAVPVMLSAYLGTRRSETLALRWSDVNYDAGEIVVRRSVTQTRPDGITIRETTKTGKRRHIPLDMHTVSELKRLQAEQRKRRMTHRKTWKGAESPADDWICATTEGAMIEPTPFAGQFRNCAERIGMDNITPHLLRHAFVSQLIALDYDAVTIAAITGHSPDVLLRTYAHAFDKRKREAVDMLGAARVAARAAL